MLLLFTMLFVLILINLVIFADCCRQFCPLTEMTLPGVAHLGKTLRAPASTSLEGATVFPSAAAVLSSPTTGFANDLTPLDAATAGSAARAALFPAFSSV